MGKYTPLGDFLRTQRTQEVSLSFDEIERITGTKLPPKAQHHRAWWSNNQSNNVMTKFWIEAGYETERVDMAGRKLVFRRTVHGRSLADSVPTTKKTTAAQAVGRHPLRGLLKDVTRVPPGVDLTEPACPEWADLLDEKYGPEVR